ncbi:MAG: urea carboxylase [Marinospirillum sp.]|uniref:urea carboxylase n=1 Tax=Marinospirillum sp. TaxID=2183934 RepID=UPI0019EBDFA7|nr:urea carboxylase [Marinospirillum sp.]MBE0507018.1 urea carboxylase [Marinospirillum sp.]
MFSKVLIANRGAIAVRLLRTLKKLGITSVVVYHASDARSLHVQLADEAWPLGDGSAAETYLNMDLLLDIARQSGAEAIHPGYGFLSEKPEFVRRCEAAGLVFIGPTAEQMEMFGLKHRARELAQKAGVPLLPGSDLLKDLESACQVAVGIGYPVMLKSTAGGGGIGMQVCADEAALREGFERVKRLGSNNFADDGVFLEKFVARARHIEVQVFGDGRGQALALGERDCSSQRRNQKVVEECPAPGLSDAQQQQLHVTAERLLASVNYRNAGTVEFIYDADRDDFYFLEVNTRLQVEHGVTEEVFGIDLVAWMLQLAAAEPLDLQQQRQALQPQGHAIQVRIYAEDPWRNFQPSPGLLSQVLLPELPGVRIDHWIETGIEVPALFDPMLAKVIVHGADRAAALQQLQSALQQIQLYGTQTNLDYLQALCVDPVLQAGQVTTAYLNHFRYQPARIDVLQPGTQTTLQDWPGRQGHWDVGVPPSGPFDSYSFRLGNRLLGNAEGATALEITLQGPLLEFSCATQVLLAGAPAEVLLNGVAVSHWQVLLIQPGDKLQIGRIQQGTRAYLCVRGGIQCPGYLGSTSTFTLGQFGGHNGRALRSGDVLQLTANTPPVQPQPLDAALLPEISSHWQLRVIYGPHGAPDYFTGQDIQSFFAANWEVHYNSSRTGIRLIGPKPDWARRDGGEAGMHPSNIHDNAYAFGTVDFTGDMPVILGPDGPSLGGFVCPATVITADLWKLGQLRAGDRIRFVPVSLDTAVALEAAQQQSLQHLQSVPCDWQPVLPTSPILEHLPASEFGDDILIRAAGDHFLLVEYGKQQLDLRLRFRAHALMQWLQQHPLPGLKELTPGVRSLQLHFDSQQLSHRQLLKHLRSAEQQLARQLNQLTVPSRTVWLPLSWDDEACQLAIRKYMQSVRKDAPWCPSNLEFIRRINGLDSLDEVKRIVFEAAYLVMGLGDVYLGAPLATPLDPRHRLVTTKYNPARTWTAENSVGIGGSYLCVYGMEGPGGYQFVGRTLQMWNRERTTREFTRPWLLRFFDQIRFYEVSAEELQQIRRDFPLGDYSLKIEEGHFSLAEYETFLETEQADIQQFVQQREVAFETELAHWHTSGQFNFTHEEAEQTEQQLDWPEGSLLADSPVSGSVWQLQVAVGDSVQAGQTLLVLESMKMEIPVLASAPGVVEQLLVNAGGRVTAGQPLVVMSATET